MSVLDRGTPRLQDTPRRNKTPTEGSKTAEAVAPPENTSETATPRGGQSAVAVAVADDDTREFDGSSDGDDETDGDRATGEVAMVCVAVDAVLSDCEPSVNKTEGAKDAELESRLCVMVSVGLRVTELVCAGVDEEPCEAVDVCDGANDCAWVPLGGADDVRDAVPDSVEDGVAVRDGEGNWLIDEEVDSDGLSR